MRVYVQNMRGEPLMPCSPRKARVLLKEKKAIVVMHTPFTIRLTIATGETKQEITLGVDAGSKTIGLSACTEEEELYAAEVQLRNDISKLLAARRECRSFRRSRKTRYRKARFDNRTGSKKPGWLAPSVQQKVETHLRAVEKVHQILPVTKIIVETASFDIQKIKNPEISGTEYQQGDQLGFWNVREYVLWRDGHTCQCCRGKSKDPVLNVHHIESRKTGGDSPGNLVTLCETCHSGYHNGKVTLPGSIRRNRSYRDAAFMGIMRWAFYNRLKAIYPDVTMTYGYITKNVRIQNGLPKEHAVDARCIAGKPLAKPAEDILFYRKLRCHNRQIHKMIPSKGGKRKRNQAPYFVQGYRLFDKVIYDGRECFITGRRQSGYFALKTFSGEKVHNSASSRKLVFLEEARGYIIQRISRKEIAG